MDPEHLHDETERILDLLELVIRYVIWFAALMAVLKVFEIARAEKIPTYLAADRLAEQRIRAVGSMVRTWPQWPNK